MPSTNRYDRSQVLLEEASRRVALGSKSLGYLPPAKLWLVSSDVVCVVLGYVCAMAVVVPIGRMSPLAAQLIVLAVTSTLFVGAAYVLGLYDDASLRRIRCAWVPVAVATVVSGAVASAILDDVLPVQAARRVCAAAVLMAAATLIGTRLGRRMARSHGVLFDRCVIVGSRKGADRVVELLGCYPAAGILPIGFVDTSNRPVSNDPELPVLGHAGALDCILSAHGITRVVLAGATLDPAMLRAIRAARYRGVRVCDLASLHEELAREVRLEAVDDQWLLNAAISSSRLHARFFKRASDLLGLAVLAVPAALLVAAAAIAVKISSRGPVIFRQERCGLHGRTFDVLKLRTMYQDAESHGPMWSTDRDPRITPVGRLLRKFRIDELPQLVNVFRGEMSLIGPRPERPVFTAQITAKVPLFVERLMVRPGLTGWAQVMAPYAASIEDSQKKLQLDLYYAKHMSVGLDMLIIVKTIKTIVFGRERGQGGMVTGNQLAGAPLTRA